MHYSYKDVEFTKNSIIIHTEEKDIIIKLKEIFAMYYARFTFASTFFAKYESYARNILYIIKDDCMKREDMITISYPYKKLVTIPRPFFERIVFGGPDGGSFPVMW